jgi:D-arginine dehydrogenase
VRPDGVAGLLLCPCDESEHAPGLPSVDPQAADLLAEKLLEYAPGLAEIALQNSWACLRTFAPDRLPVIDWDPEISGLFHVSALGGFGMTTSLAVGELAATRIRGGNVDWIGAEAFSARREALSTLAAEGV